MQWIQLNWKEFYKKRVHWKILMGIITLLLLSIIYFKLFQEGAMINDIDRATYSLEELNLATLQEMNAEELTDEQSAFLSEYSQTYYRQREAYTYGRNLESVIPQLARRLTMREEASELFGSLADDHLESVEEIQKNIVLVNYLVDNNLPVESHAYQNRIITNLIVVFSLGGAVALYAFFTSHLLGNQYQRQTLYEILPVSIFTRRLSTYIYSVMVYLGIPFIAVCLVLVGYSLFTQLPLWTYPFLIPKGVSYLAIPHWQVLSLLLGITVCATVLIYLLLVVIYPLLEDADIVALIIILLVVFPWFVMSKVFMYSPLTYTTLTPILNGSDQSLIMSWLIQLAILLGSSLIVMILVKVIQRNSNQII